MLERPVIPRSGDRAARAVTTSFQLVFALVAAGLVVSGAWPRGVVVALLVPAMQAPPLLERLSGRQLPTHVSVQFGAFLVAGPLAGAALGLYSALPGWDKVVHADSGVLIAATGLALVPGRRRFTAFLLVLASAMAIAAGWEIVEFTSDHLIGTRAQHNNTDTMTDIIAGTVGATATLVLVGVTARRRHRARARGPRVPA